MKQFKNPFGLYENKELIYIRTGDDENREKYKKCYCTECGEKLIPKMGQKNSWHFSHESYKNCQSNFETSLHLYAKEVIKKNNRIAIPGLSIGEYLGMNKLDESFITDLHEWENENKERLSNKELLKPNIYDYKWISCESRIGDFIPDCIVEIGGKKVAIEILVTHEVDCIKTEKVYKKKMDMIEIDLGLVKYEIENNEFDLEEYILNNAIRWWIYKTKIETEEEKLYEKIYNTKKYILNNKYTRDELIKKRKIEIEKKKQEQTLRIQKEKQRQDKIKYAIEHKDEYEKKRKVKIKNIIEKYSLKKQNNTVSVCNIPVKGEYAFDCARDIWQSKIYDKFILNREGKTIQLAKIIYWIEHYSDLIYYNEFNIYNKVELWNSKYDAVREYLIQLAKISVLLVLDDNLNQWGEIKVLDSNKIKATSKISVESSKIKFCNNCGVVWEDDDFINKFYIDNFGVDKECFEELLNI